MLLGRRNDEASAGRPFLQASAVKRIVGYGRRIAALSIRPIRQHERASALVFSRCRETRRGQRNGNTRFRFIKNMSISAGRGSFRGRVSSGWILNVANARGVAWKACWTQGYSTPPVLALDEHGELCQQPLPELQRLRGERFRTPKQRIGAETIMPITGIRGSALEIRAVFARGSASRTGLRLRRSDDGQEETIVFYDWSKQSITVDRSKSSLNPDVARTVDTGPFQVRAGEPLELHVLLDHSMIEVFVNGRGTLSSRIYPIRHDSDGVALFCDGPADLESFDMWKMNRA